jgi:radical SAM protein with 4Fe4S-binding SPASM domain
MSLAEIRAVVRTIADLGGEEVTLIGGEALLRDDWQEIGQAVRDAGMKLLLLTNGLRLARDDDALRALGDLAPYLVGVSIDGASRESYQRLRGVDGFDDVVALCRRMVDLGFEHVNAVTTFWRANLGDFDRFAELLAETGITWQVQMANKGGDRFAATEFLSLDGYRLLTDKMRAALIAEPRQLALCPMDDFGYFPLDPALSFLHDSWRGCQAGIEVVGIRSNGDVLGCLSLGDEFVEDNLRRRPLADLWHDPQSFARFRRKARYLAGHCASCAMAERCGAGCTAMAYSATGSIGENPYCLRHLEAQRIVREATLG